jgi:hypothetical protein
MTLLAKRAVLTGPVDHVTQSVSRHNPALLVAGDVMDGRLGEHELAARVF